MSYLHNQTEETVPKLTREQVAESIRVLAVNLKGGSFSRKVFDELNATPQKMFTVAEASLLTEKAYCFLKYSPHQWN